VRTGDQAHTFQRLFISESLSDQTQNRHLALGPIDAFLSCGAREISFLSCSIAALLYSFGLTFLCVVCLVFAFSGKLYCRGIPPEGGTPKALVYTPAAARKAICFVGLFPGESVSGTTEVAIGRVAL